MAVLTVCYGELAVFSPKQPVERADTVYTVSSATDHYREQARGAGLGVEKCPEFTNFTSSLPHYPNTSFRLKNGDKVPHFVGREFRAPTNDPAELRTRCLKAGVNGPNRHKHSQRPFLTSNTPIVIIKAPKPMPTAQEADQEANELDAIAAARTIGTQSDFRESEVQTEPFSPEAAPLHVLSAKEAAHSALHHCSGAPELAHLESLKFSLNQAPGSSDVAKINKLRAKRAFEATLPPLNDMKLLPLRQKMMEAWEQQEWDEREGQLQAAQDERLQLLKQAILVREGEIEDGHADRVQATTDRLLAAKQGAFAAVQKNRVKAIRHFSEARKCVPCHRCCLPLYLGACSPPL